MRNGVRDAASAPRRRDAAAGSVWRAGGQRSAAGPAALLARRERGRARDLGSFPKTSSTKGPFPSCAPRRRALCGVAGSGPSRTRRSPTNSAGVFFAARGAAPPHDRSEPFFYDGCLDTAWHALPQKLSTRPDSAYAYRRGRLSVGVAGGPRPVTIFNCYLFVNTYPGASLHAGYFLGDTGLFRGRSP